MSVDLFPAFRFPFLTCHLYSFIPYPDANASYTSPCPIVTFQDIIGLIHQATVPEVCIYSNGQLFRANRTSLVHEQSGPKLQSFSSPPLIAYEGDEWRTGGVTICQPRGPFQMHAKLDTGIVVLSLLPGLSTDYLGKFRSPLLPVI